MQHWTVRLLQPLPMGATRLAAKATSEAAKASAMHSNGAGPADAYRAAMAVSVIEHLSPNGEEMICGPRQSLKRDENEQSCSVRVAVRQGLASCETRPALSERRKLKGCKIEEFN